MKRITTSTFETPCGLLHLGATDEGLCHLGWSPMPDSRSSAFAIQDGMTPILEQTFLQLSEYFQGRRQVFDLPLHFLLGTDFQRACWLSLARIPYASTISYGQQARWIGREKAVRAVGQANHRNPIAIILPCHRVVGSNGALVGYGGGLDKKRFLLEMEKKVLSQISQIAQK